MRERTERERKTRTERENGRDKRQGERGERERTERKGSERGKEKGQREREITGLTDHLITSQKFSVSFSGCR